MWHLLWRVPPGLHGRKLCHLVVFHQSASRRVFIKLVCIFSYENRFKDTKYYLPVPCVKDCPICTTENQSRTIRYRMGDSNGFYFKWASIKSPLCPKCLEPGWNKDPKLLQPLLNKLLKPWSINDKNALIHMFLKQINAGNIL